MKLFTKEDTLSIKGIDQLFSEDFQKFLKRRFELQTATNYFQKFKTLLNYAVKRKIILSNPAQSVKNSGKKDSIKVYLTIDEIIQLSKTECESPQIKNAFLFACLTGLRHIDIRMAKYKK